MMKLVYPIWLKLCLAVLYCLSMVVRAWAATIEARFESQFQQLSSLMANAPACD